LRLTPVRGTQKKELTAFWQGVDKYLDALAGILKLVIRLPLAVLVAVETGLETFFREMGGSRHAK